MLLLIPFLATLMVATVGHVSAEETLPISLLAVFDTEILSPVKAYCRKLGEIGIKRLNDLCGPVDALDKEFNVFGIKIMEQLNLAKHETDEWHSIFATIHTHIKKDRLEMPKVKPGLKDDYHKFVTEVGKHIFGTYAYRTVYLAANKEASGSNAEKWETHKNAEKEKNDKFESLKNDFLAEVNTFYKSLLRMHAINDMDWNVNRILGVGKKIYGNCAGADVEKQLEFFLDYFAVDVHYFAIKNGYFMPVGPWKNDHGAMK